MYLISFLSIQKAESTSHPFERGKVTAYHHHINRSASYSSAKTVTARLDFAPPQQFNYARRCRFPLQRRDRLRNASC
jgi:hypothetical protein